MRIVAWNLRGGTDAKWDVLTGLGPDVAVLPEAARTPKRAAPSLLGPGPEWHWVGRNAAKGLAVATFGRPSAVAHVDVSGRWSVGAIVPVRPAEPAPASVPHPRRGRTLFVLGIWSCPLQTGGYGREVVRAVEAHAERIRRTPSIVAGDFNIDANTSEQRRSAAFTKLVRTFSALGLSSAYHHCLGEPFGAETRPTYYHHRDRQRPFHIDYCFLSQPLLERVREVEVGLYGDWVEPGLSDHVPVIVDLAD